MRVLFVCTGNICRSPIAERLFAARLELLGIEASVSSAGTRALAGTRMTKEAVDVLSAAGIDPGRHTARVLTPDLVLNADLVLTATRAHRAAVASLVPAASRRSFTLREFARVADFVATQQVDSEASTEHPAAKLQQLVHAAPTQRGLAVPPATPEDDDILDPYGRAPDVYAEAGELIERAIDAILSPLAAPIVRGDRVGT
ncbi:low molecular weight phosphatase family protein [Agromyces intestinalis]|uniref:Low molecular weight phosphatase family protein n=1 Tax=Agromyces intestinalis TaxID=2592652 RepID=A0A5C1YCE0_9MICO|nr:low molecular weight phosphatase family protein [Agromyces intestinalis]QEO13676.1 low molecular weight phosphatase family protein [Agromyces intestinalis]